jgi:hypothetical protein
MDVVWVIYVGGMLHTGWAWVTRFTIDGWVNGIITHTQQTGERVQSGTPPPPLGCLFLTVD